MCKNCVFCSLSNKIDERKSEMEARKLHWGSPGQKMAVRWQAKHLQTPESHYQMPRGSGHLWLHTSKTNWLKPLQSHSWAERSRIFGWRPSTKYTLPCSFCLPSCFLQDNLILPGIFLFFCWTSCSSTMVLCLDLAGNYQWYRLTIVVLL